MKHTNLLPINLLTFNLLTFFALAITTPCLSQEKSTMTDPRDGHVYRTVMIGKQTWMAENLAWLPAVDLVGTGLFEEKCHYVYGYSGTNVAEARKTATYPEFGALYNWIAAKSACPDGWHLPTDQEWMQLEKTIGMSGQETVARDYRTSGNVGEKLRSSAGWVKGNGTDPYGFAALPGGCRGYGGFEGKGYAVFFWSASTIDGDNGFRRSICSDNPGICRQEDRRYFGCSVRCVKN